jgi:hypothetical protein
LAFSAILSCCAFPQTSSRFITDIWLQLIEKLTTSVWADRKVIISRPQVQRP